MKLTNREIVDSISVLSDIASIQLPVRVSYAISKNISFIEKELEIYNNERQKLINTYAEKDENGDVFIDEDNNVRILHLDKWKEDFNELLDIEVDVNIHKFNINDLLNSNCSISPNDIRLIDYMIID